MIWKENTKLQEFIMKVCRNSNKQSKIIFDQVYHIMINKKIREKSNSELHFSNTKIKKASSQVL